MRSLELVLTLVNLCALLAPLLPRSGLGTWTRFLSLLPLLAALVQVLGEGPRWQMAPAYALAAALALRGLAGLLLPATALPRPAAALLGILALLAFALSAALPLVLPVFRFPKPSGPYAIGTTSYRWIDRQRPELFTAEPGDHREILAQVWYPAAADARGKAAPYLEDAGAMAPALARVARLPSFFFSHFKYLRTNALEAVPVAAEEASYPVLIYLTGQSGFRSASTFQIEELVSRGYIVVGLDQPGAVALVTLSDGRKVEALPRELMYPLTVQSVEPLPKAPTLLGRPLPGGIVPYFAEDIPFVLDRLADLDAADPRGILTGRLDLARTGIFGISGGGIDAAEAALKDRRLKACLIMDVFMSTDVVSRGLDIPALWITRDAATMRLEREKAGGWTEKDIEQHQRTMRQAYLGLRNRGYYLQIPGIFHLNFIDTPYWLPISSQLGMTGPVDSRRMFALINAYSAAFFDRHLRGLPAPLLDGPSPLYPEVRFESRQP